MISPVLIFLVLLVVGETHGNNINEIVRLSTRSKARNADVDFSIKVGDPVISEWDKTDPCPENCVCNNEGFVNCSRLHLTTLPKLPIQTTNVDLSINDIRKLSDDAFAGLPKLQQVSLDENKLDDKSFAQHTFRSANALTILYLGSNNLTKIPRNLPENITNLNIYGCGISLIDFGSSFYPKLSTLSLNQNALIYLYVVLGNNAPNLTNLDVSFNNLSDSSILPSTFQGLTKLKYLNLRFNHLTTVPKLIPNSLQYLDLVGNSITILHSHAFSHLPKLLDLSMWQSPLTTIEDNAFEELTHLTMLELMDCKVTSNLTNHTLNGLQSVEEIDMSLSKIPQMAIGTLAGLNKLETLWLNDNPFTSLPEGVFSSSFIPKISVIYLWGDQWNCDCSLSWLKKYQENSSIIQDPHLMKCKTPEHLTGKTWDIIKADQFVC